VKQKENEFIDGEICYDRLEIDLDGYREKKKEKKKVRRYNIRASEE